jgi:very-short-patch-repair endonuclease
MTEHFNRSSETAKRRFLRRSMTPAEVRLWSRLRGRQLLDCKFRRQYSVGPYVIDFYCPELKLGIEVDGDSHFHGGVQSYDDSRRAYIETFGITIVRFTDAEVCDNMDGVLETIANEIRSLAGHSAGRMSHDV